MSKPCSKCREVKPLTSFNKDKSRKLGVTPQCKDCMGATARAWAKNNRERHNANCLKWQKNNPEYVRSWAQANREAMREADRRWRKNNPSKVAEKSARRRAAYKDTNDPRIGALYAIAACFRAEGRDVHVDHIRPLSKGGTHTFENLQILTAEDNLRKGTKSHLLGGVGVVPDEE